MKTMKRALVLLWGAVALAAVAAGQPALKSVQSVYLLPMTNGLEQYLANQLTEQGVFRVVTDPKKADALLTDEIGEKFERRLEELYPPPPKVEEKKDESAADEAQPAVSSGGSLITNDEPRPISSFSRGRGNVFLVDRQSGSVLWSTYQPRKDGSSKSLNKAAAKIVGELRHSVGASQ